MILQLQAKVHGLGYLGVSTCTYPIFSEFKAPKSDPSLPSSLHHDQYARGVVVCFKGAVGFPTLLVGWLVGRLFVCLFVCMVGWLVG